MSFSKNILVRVHLLFELIVLLIIERELSCPDVGKNLRCLDSARQKSNRLYALGN